MTQPIKYSQFRDNQELGKPQQVSVERALRCMLMAELSFGGAVTKIDETKVVVTTHVMGLQDVSVFEGTQDDLLLLLEAAYYWAVISTNCPESVRQNAIKRVFEKYPEGTLIKPMEMIVGGQIAQILVGERVANCVMAAMLVDETDADLIPTLVKRRADDLFAALVLSRLEGVGVRDAIALMG